MKLELKHIIPYYEHNLKCLNTEDNKIYYLTGLSNPFKTVKRDYVCLEIREPKLLRNWSFVLDDKTCYKIKPLLHPLSDLTKEIEHNGKKFVPNEILEQNAVSKYWWQSINTKGISPCAHFNLMLLLFKWHFDVFGLIEKGLAIDINTLK